MCFISNDHIYQGNLNLIHVKIDIFKLNYRE